MLSNSFEGKKKQTLHQNKFHKDNKNNTSCYYSLSIIGCKNWFKCYDTESQTGAVWPFSPLGGASASVVLACRVKSWMKELAHSKWLSPTAVQHRTGFNLLRQTGRMRNCFTLVRLTEVDSYMQSQHFFLKPLTESGSTGMQDWVTDSGEKLHARDSPWWNSPSCSSLTVKKDIEIQHSKSCWMRDTCIILNVYSCYWPAGQSTDKFVWRRLYHLSVWCDQWSGRCRYWLCVSATGHCRLSNCTGLFRRCTPLNGSAKGDGKGEEKNHNALWLEFDLRCCWPVKRFAN